MSLRHRKEKTELHSTKKRPKNQTKVEVWTSDSVLRENCPCSGAGVPMHFLHLLTVLSVRPLTLIHVTMNIFSSLEKVKIRMGAIYQFRTDLEKKSRMEMCRNMLDMLWHRFNHFECKELCDELMPKCSVCVCGGVFSTDPLYYIWINMTQATDNRGNSWQIYIIICMDEPKHLQRKTSKTWETAFLMHIWYNNVKIELPLRISILIWEM